MTAIPITRRDRSAHPEPSPEIPAATPAASAATRFRADLTALENRYVELWHRTSSATPTLGEPVSRRRRWANARAARQLVERLADRVERHPEGDAERSAWRRRVEDEMRAFGEKRLGWPAGYRRLLFADAYYDSSVVFSRRARAFDPDLGPAEIGQAIRNVWIMNSLQMLLDRQVGHSPAIFAYSMLYPETDNYLDDPAVPVAEKKRFNRLLARRLGGQRLPGQDPRERRVFQLVGMIEEQWSRARHPQVFESLLAIHRGQVRSLEQDEPASGLGQMSHEELLSLSAAKGGASVLADGYLTAGRLSAEEADFCFGYGVFLQLLDDLQDLAEDRAAGHATLFSVSPAGEPLDRTASRLFHFMRQVVEHAPRFAEPAFRDRKDLILRNCTLLFVAAVSQHRKGFSRGFRRSLECRWPLGFAAMRRLERRSKKRFRRSFDTICRQRGVESVFDLL